MDKGPFDFFNSEYATYLTVAIATIWGGLVSYYDKMTTFSWKHLLAHLSSSSFAGFITALLCQSAGIDGPLVGVFAGVAAHMGTPALIKLMMKNPTVKRFFGEDGAK